ncbi:MAG: hypothetical protein F4053_12325 [Proteobacteria bacterium]|nr:hypothetical protein [Pseudomonadota bacterium]
MAYADADCWALAGPVTDKNIPIDEAAIPAANKRSFIWFPSKRMDFFLILYLTAFLVVNVQHAKRKFDRILLLQPIAIVNHCERVAISYAEWLSP